MSRFGQHNDGHFRITGFECLEQVNSAFVGKANIENDRVGSQALNRIDGVSAVAGLAGDPDLIGFGQKRCNPFADLVRIVYDSTPVSWACLLALGQ